MRSVFAVALVGILAIEPLAAQDQAPRLRIVIVEGEGAINNIKQRVNREPIVQVEDENRKPVAGAVVMFFLPDRGASGVFPNGDRTMTLVTDSQGRAAARGIRFNNASGQMQIRVTASFGGNTASTVITQTNMASAAAAGGISAKVITILAIAGAAAAGGVFAATRGGGSSATPAGPTPIILTPGTPAVGAPR